MQEKGKTEERRDWRWLRKGRGRGNSLWQSGNPDLFLLSMGSKVSWSSKHEILFNITLSLAISWLFKGSQCVCVVFANLNLLQMDGGAG